MPQEQQCSQAEQTSNHEEPVPQQNRSHLTFEGHLGIVLWALADAVIPARSVGRGTRQLVIHLAPPIPVRSNFLEPSSPKPWEPPGTSCLARRDGAWMVLNLKIASTVASQIYMISILACLCALDPWQPFHRMQCLCRTSLQNFLELGVMATLNLGLV